MTISFGPAADHGTTKETACRPCPARPDLTERRHQAKDLLRAARRGDLDALARIHAVSDRVVLSSAQLTLAREYGFPSWRPRGRPAGPTTSSVPTCSATW